MTDTERIAQAEEIIRAQDRLIEDMYNTSMEVVWSKDSGPLIAQYEQRYSVDLSGDADPHTD